jgi:peptidoglycan/LPS O-acetylase OafA/YrhL
VNQKPPNLNKPAERVKILANKAMKLKVASEAVTFEAVQPKTQETADPRTHMMEMSGLRGIAIIVVFYKHLAGHWSTVFGPLWIPFLSVDMRTYFNLIPGVSLFFVLSGYLLLWTEGKRARRGAYCLRSYALRRALRIVPAYYVAIVVFILIGPHKTSAPDVFWHMSFLHGFHPN